MTSWGALTAELDAWADAGRTAEFWWRDDDAVEPTPALDRLLDLRDAAGVPLAIAVIPAGAGAPLAARLDGVDGIDVLQHGYAHANHRPAGEKKAELGGERDLWTVAGELAAGRGRLLDLFGAERLVDVMVPPWNRIDPAVTAALPGLGYHGLTAFRPRTSPEPVVGLTVVNTHVDIMDWGEVRGFAGEAPVLGAVVRHLADRRAGAADPAEATGLLTHHLAHDAACWAFLDRFFATVTAHPAVRWADARTLFPAPP